MNRRAFFSVVPALAVAPMVPAVAAESPAFELVGIDAVSVGYSILTPNEARELVGMDTSATLREISNILVSIRESA